LSDACFIFAGFIISLISGGREGEPEQGVQCIYRVCVTPQVQETSVVAEPQAPQAPPKPVLGTSTDITMLSAAVSNSTTNGSAPNGTIEIGDQDGFNTTKFAWNATASTVLIQLRALLGINVGVSRAR
jgi:hypothetical protein